METTQISIVMRPRKLADVFGQPGVVKELTKRQVSNNWPRAMLFKGPTGTGKTTCAQIVAMSIQCTNPDSEGNPCLVCDECKSILTEQFDRGTEVLDAGASGGKKDILEILQGAETASFYGPKKIFIIEESDQLSSAAMSVMLKILEKPQANTHFILLSMLSGGVPKEIRDRCQTFNFNPFRSKDIMYALKGVMEKTGKWSDSTIPDEFKIQGLGAISLASQGSLRCGVEYLEKCLVGEYYTAKDIRENLGIIDEALTNDALTHLLNRDTRFFSEIDSIDISEFFNIAYSAISEAFVYSITGVHHNEYFEAQVKLLSSNPSLREVAILFDEIYVESRGYIKKAYFYNKIATYFARKIQQPAAVASRAAAEREPIQARLDKIARDKAVETTGLGPQTSLGRIPVRS